jgi:flavin reductase (DIM6/NTAB) family NADH-FMN oxidoreductase RutF
MIDGARFRRTMGHFATGVAVATTRRADGSLAGLTCNSLASVSLDPPLVLICVDHGASTREDLLDAGHFALSLLGSESEAVSLRFASGSREVRFDGIEVRTEVTGAPVLEGALAWLDCTLWKVTEAGDHTVLFGKVEAAGFDPEADPLVFFRGRYGSLRP